MSHSRRRASVAFANVTKGHGGADSKLEKRESAMATLEEKISAVNLVCDKGLSLRQAERECGASRETIRRWKRQLEGGASFLHSPAEPGSATEGGVLDIEGLPNDPERLKRMIFDMRFEMDLKEAVVEMLKKTQASTRRGSRTGRRPFWWTP